MDHPVRIVIADDHEVFRRGLVSLLQSHPGWTVVAEAENGEQAIHRVAHHQPDIAILDLVMPGLIDGLAATRELMRLSPKPRILILTMHASKQLVHDLLEAGARGYVMKADAGRHLITAIETLLEGKLFFTTTVCEILLDGFLQKPAQPRPESVITKRETEVLKLLAAGRTNKQIAAELQISLRTAETHRANIMHKLQLRSVSDLVRYAVKHKLVD
jgi:DNA-binding NarL/FixJ family response regulator